jgi:DNA-binding response OmpR family regulator
MKVLVVDDSPETAEGLAAVAKEMGHTVSVAYSARSARDFAESEAFDVILFDVVLPDGDGIALCQHLRNEGASQDACMIAITGRTDLGADAFAFFDGYLHKPITWPALKHALEMWSVIEPASDDAPASGLPDQSATATPPALSENNTWLPDRLRRSR